MLPGFQIGEWQMPPAPPCVNVPIGRTGPAALPQCYASVLLLLPLSVPKPKVQKSPSRTDPFGVWETSLLLAGSALLSLGKELKSPQAKGLAVGGHSLGPAPNSSLAEHEENPKILGKKKK